MPVQPAEVDEQQHNHYLDVLARGTDPLRDAMLQMATAAGAYRKAQTPSTLSAAVAAMTEVNARAAQFLRRMEGTLCPSYLRGADQQIQDALKLTADGGQRGATAGAAGDGAGLISAAGEMEVANQDMVVAASRIAAWQSGAARP